MKVGRIAFWTRKSWGVHLREPALSRVGWGVSPIYKDNAVFGKFQYF